MEDAAPAVAQLLDVEPHAGVADFDAFALRAADSQEAAPGGLVASQDQLAGLALDAKHACLQGQVLDLEHEEQVLHRLGPLAEAVLELGGNVVDLRGLGDARHAVVEAQPRRQVGDIGIGQMGRHGQLDTRRGPLGRRGDIASVEACLELLHGIGQQPHVEVKPDGHDLAALLGPQQVAGTTYLEVLHSDLEAGAQVGGGEDGLEALLRNLAYRALWAVQQVGIGAVRAAADTPPELVELRQPEVVSVVDDERVRVGDVETRLDDGGAQQDVGLAGGEVHHHLF